MSTHSTLRSHGISTTAGDVTKFPVIPELSACADIYESLQDVHIEQESSLSDIVYN